jgi:hypothetical protein
LRAVVNATAACKWFVAEINTDAVEALIANGQMPPLSLKRRRLPEG